MRLVPSPVRWLAAAAALLLMAAACAGSDGEAPAGANLFLNPGFEDGRDPWFSLKPPDFILSQDLARSGKASALLPLRALEGDTGNKIIYLVQELQPRELPEEISGYYRVERWEKGTEKQYVQFVVIVFGADNMPGGFNNHQIRYILSGIDAPPFQIANAKFVFISREEPPLGEWVPFKRNLREDFQELWGAVPEGFENIRVLFEVRYDDKLPGEGPVAADVYYDDLYMGPAR